MVKCPYCAKEISFLIAYSREQIEQSVDLDPDNPSILQWGDSDFVDGTCDKIDFECPECHETLFSNSGESDDERVKEFLKTGRHPDKKERFVFR